MLARQNTLVDNDQKVGVNTIVYVKGGTVSRECLLSRTHILAFSNFMSPVWGSIRFYELGNQALGYLNRHQSGPKRIL